MPHRLRLTRTLSLSHTRRCTQRCSSHRTAVDDRAPTTAVVTREAREVGVEEAVEVGVVQVRCTRGTPVPTSVSASHTVHARLHQSQTPRVLRFPRRRRLRADTRRTSGDRVDAHRALPFTTARDRLAHPRRRVESHPRSHCLTANRMWSDMTRSWLSAVCQPDTLLPLPRLIPDAHWPPKAHAGDFVNLQGPNARPCECGHRSLTLARAGRAGRRP